MVPTQDRQVNLLVVPSPAQLAQLRLQEAIQALSALCVLLAPTHLLEALVVCP
jgi:hypothetical protein